MPILDGELRTAAREVFDEATRKSWEDFFLYGPHPSCLPWGPPIFEVRLADDGTPALDENGQWIWERRS